MNELAYVTDSTAFAPQDLEAVRAATAQARTLPEQAAAIQIRTAHELDDAAAFLGEIKARRKAIEAAFEPMIAAALKAHREALALKRQADEPCLKAEEVVKAKIADYSREQTRLRLEAERQFEEERRRREAEARAEAERVAAAERRRLEDERLAEAAAAEAAGDTRRAERLLEQPIAEVASIVVPVIPPAPPVLPPRPQATGISMRQTYRWKLVDARAVKPAFLTPDEKKIAATVRALGPDAVEAVGGIQVWPETTVAARARN